MSWRKSAIVAAAAATGLVTLVGPRPSGPVAAAESEPVPCSDLGSAVATQPDGRIIAGGSTFTNEVVEEPSGAHDHVGDFALVRYLPSGQIDASFGAGGRVITDFRDFDAINALIVDRRGILAVGTTGRDEDGTLGDKDVALARYHRDGRLDDRFGDGGTLTVDLGGDDIATSVAVDRRGRTVVAGRSTGSGTARAVLLRLTRTGRMDPTFGDHGQRWFPAAEGFHGVVIGALGRIVAAGQTRAHGSAAIVVARFTETGRPHLRFGTAGRVVTALPDTEAGTSGTLALRAGRILVTLDVSDATGSQVAVVRHRPSGRLDTRFGDAGRLLLDPPGDISTVTAATTTKGNRPILVGSGYPDDYATGQAVMTRLTARGRPDPTFGEAGTVTERFRLEYAGYRDVVTGPGGTIIAVGWDLSEGENLPLSDLVLARYTRDGQLDSRFGDGGTVFTDVHGGYLECERHDHDH